MSDLKKLVRGSKSLAMKGGENIFFDCGSGRARGGGGGVGGGNLEK